VLAAADRARRRGEVADARARLHWNKQRTSNAMRAWRATLSDADDYDSDLFATNERNELQ